MPLSYDVAIIGGGPGGYVAAIRAAQLGFNTVCIDDWKNAKGKSSLGGACVNVGCIPSKALLESSENYERVLHKFADHGIVAKSVELDLAKMLARKDKIVDQLTSGVAFLFRKNKVTFMPGHGHFVSGGEAYQIEVVEGDKRESISAKHVIIATGSVPRALSVAPVDNALILDNVGALSMPKVPNRLGVIGAGVIGLEMGTVWQRLGSEVTILEAMPEFLPAVDEQVAAEAFKIFSKTQKLNIRLDVSIKSIKTTKDGVNVTFTNKGRDAELEVDKLIVAVGRAPNTTGLNLEAIGLKTDARGFVEVDEHCKTQAPGVYAIGDVVRGPMLAHKAFEEGVVAAERIAGQSSHLNLMTVPWVIYTAPEVAWVGQSEQQLKAAGIGYRAGSFPFSANGRAKGLGETSGFVKMIADAGSDRILGVHIIGPFASELISEAVVAMEFGASSEDIALIIHAHPSLSEVFHEAALAVDNRSMHI
ncbi:MAG: dihydrolipoyl dehydrogenase [Pseudomonadota bacterium]|nr:dihydrolipoyl dehydrogenase [Pseudomonadota bacterium]